MHHNSSHSFNQDREPVPPEASDPSADPVASNLASHHNQLADPSSPLQTGSASVSEFDLDRAIRHLRRYALKVIASLLLLILLAIGTLAHSAISGHLNATPVPNTNRPEEGS